MHAPAISVSGVLPGGQEAPSPPPPPPDAGEGVLLPLDPGHMSHVTGQYCSAMTLDSLFIHPFMLYVFMTKEAQSERSPLRELPTSAFAKPSSSSTQLPPPDAGEGVLPSPWPPPSDVGAGELLPWPPLVTTQMHSAVARLHVAVDVTIVLKYNDDPIRRHPGAFPAEEIMVAVTSLSPNIIAAASHSDFVVMDD